MLDTTALEKLVKEQLTKTVNDQVLSVFSSDEWLHPLEEKIIKFSQDRILAKFASSEAVPEILKVVQTSVAELFASGQIPGIETYVDQQALTSAIDIAVEENVKTAMDRLSSDSVWIEKIQTLVTQIMTQRVVSQLSTVDISDVIRRRVDKNMENFVDSVTERLDRKGIQDLATACELTVLDGNVVVENQFTTKLVNVVESATVRDLVVTGSINVDNHSWDSLRGDITEKTLTRVNEEWREQLVDQVTKKIIKKGIEFTQIKLDGEYVVSEGTLARTITKSNLQSVGVLDKLQVKGEIHAYNDTFNVLNRRLGVNTIEPEMALSVWDEEVSVLTGKFKANTAYIGTGRKQSLAIGVNREPGIEIDQDGLTTVKNLRIGVHRISHASDLPNYAGSKGDIVFNANPNINSNVFGWQCLGGHKWKVIRVVE